MSNEIEMLDLSGLNRVDFRRELRGFRGAYYLDASGAVVAKTCSSCHEVLRASSFNRGSLRGLHGRCRECDRAYNNAPSSNGQGTAADERTRRRTIKNRARTEEQIREDRQSLRPDGLKRCGTCRLERPVSEYHRCSSLGDGLQATCKSCRSIKDADRYARAFIAYWEANDIPIRCYLCDGPYEEVEHVWCQSSGGPDVPQNTLPVCIECNRGPGGKHTKQFFSYIWDKYPPGERGRIINRVALEYGVWPFDQPYVAEDWEVSA